MATNDSADSSKDFCDEFYTEDTIAAFEKLNGHGYIGSQGKAMTEEMAPLLSPKEGDKILDVGSGIGGMAIHLAKVYGADVLGIDISTAVIKVGRMRAASADLGKGNVSFDVADAMQANISEGAYDFVILRSAFMHFPYDVKYPLLEKTFKWLKPGGRFLLNDMHSVIEHDDLALQNHMKNRHWFLLPMEKILQYLKDIGYEVVLLKDRGDDYVDAIGKEIADFEARKEELSKDAAVKNILEDTHSHWKWKMEWAKKKAFGEHYILAEKPNVQLAQPGLRKSREILQEAHRATSEPRDARRPRGRSRRACTASQRELEAAGKVIACARNGKSTSSARASFLHPPKSLRRKDKESRRWIFRFLFVTG
ncbi:phosphoethanolamine N-methyltransferase-like [Oscarella lobularis]|uniref:phosphoethanolamine N-methyltransferase-like n=1 Tax=Oscarella lobularis TaxID=121494 RepID=UPI0033138C2E